MTAKLMDKHYEEYKKICDDNGIQYGTDDEMRESADNLVRFVEVLAKIDYEEKQRQHRLSSYHFSEHIVFS